MRNKIFGGIAVLVIVAIAAWNVNMSLNSQSGNKLSDMMLANVEALADVEEDSDEYIAWGMPKSCSGWFCPNGGSYTECEVNGRGNSCSHKGDRTCTCGTNCNPCS